MLMMSNEVIVAVSDYNMLVPDNFLITQLYNLLNMCILPTICDIISLL